MLRNAKRNQKIGIVRQNFFGEAAAVKFTEQAGDGFDHERIRVAIEETAAIAELRHKP